VTASIVESDDTIEHEIRIAAGPDIVFGYLTDPNLLLRWKGLKAELNPKPGGIYQVQMNDRDVMRGEYVEVTPYSRVVFTMGWEASSTLPPGKSTVEIDLIPEGNNTAPSRSSDRGTGPARPRLGPLPRTSPGRRGRVRARRGPLAPTLSHDSAPGITSEQTLIPLATTRCPGTLCPQNGWYSPGEWKRSTR
jgi:uncharacterized protein YndB with AHSA1/START domain